MQISEIGGSLFHEHRIGVRRVDILADGTLDLSDSVLEEIWNVGVRSVRCCSEDTYTDCPTYEHTFWVGDGRNEALVDLIANGDARLSENCLRIAGRSLDRSPIVESQVCQFRFETNAFRYVPGVEHDVDRPADVALSGLDRLVAGDSSKTQRAHQNPVTSNYR